MTRTLKLIGAALIAAMRLTTPASAQAVIDEPGNYAFFHPNADVLNPSRPTDAMAAQVAPDRRIEALHLSVRPHHAHHAAPARPY
jgi:hypothetical protein